MESRLADAIGLARHPVTIVWADEAPHGATRFKPGRWGCVVSMCAAAAANGRVGAFDRESYGCWGGGVGLGFGNCYEVFPAGVEGFCRFLADGNESSEQGRLTGKQLAASGERLSDEFLHGERYLETADVTHHFPAMPICDIPAKYVVVKPLGLANPEQEEIKCVTFFVTPDQISALVVGAPECARIAWSERPFLHDALAAVPKYGAGRGGQLSAAHDVERTSPSE